MNDETRPQADQITATPAPLDEQLLRAISDPGNYPLADQERGERTLPQFQRDACMAVLQGGGWVMPGMPPASKMLADLQELAPQMILAQLAVKLFRTLVLGRIVIAESPAAMQWLQGWIDGGVHQGPMGKGPMLWPNHLPTVAGLLRQWGFQPTPTVPAFVARQPQQPDLLVIEVGK